MAVALNDDKSTWYPSAESGGQVVGRFVYVKKLNIPESLEADEHRYREIIALEHRAVGSLDVSVTPLKPHNEKELRVRFAQAWAAFQGEEVEIDGTPLSELPFLSEDQILTLKIAGVHSVEQLAGLDDARCQNLGFGWRTNRGKTQEWLTERTMAEARADRVARETRERELMEQAEARSAEADALPSLDDIVPPQDPRITAALSASGVKEQKRRGRPPKAAAH